MESIICSGNLFSIASSSYSPCAASCLVLLPCPGSSHSFLSTRPKLKLDHSSTHFRPIAALSDSSAFSNSTPTKDGIYTVGEFMTKKELLHVVKPTTTIDEALETLVDKRITGFPVIDEDWKLVGLVSDYDLLALDSVSGGGVADTSMFPEADRSWKLQVNQRLHGGRRNARLTFNEIQKLLSKTNGKVIADVMTPAPLVVCETTNLEDAARLLLETKYRRLPVVDSNGKLVGIITRGNVVRAALRIKRETEKTGVN